MGKKSQCRPTESNLLECTHKVVAEELHDEGGVLVALLTQCVELGNSVIEGLLGEVASLVRSVENLVVEDGEVEGKAETDGVSGRKLGLGNVGSVLVGVERLVGGVLALVANGELGEVTVVVTLPITGVSERQGKRLGALYAYILW